MQKSFHKIPRQRPATPILDRIDLPADLRCLPEEELSPLVDELREYLLYTVGQTGGHFGAGLGVVELTLALHYTFSTPWDRIVWDVGHQAYPHKILTGRRDQMSSLRQAGGLAAFPNRAESEYDAFGTGHSSTSVSAALGMALAARQLGERRRSVAVIGDGALTAGMAFEALNHAAHERADMLVVLNDNDMSISRNVGGLHNYLARILSSHAYISVREGGKRILHDRPTARELVKKAEEQIKAMVAPSTLFEELGFNYIGPIDGHDVELLTQTLRNMRDLRGPQFLHIVTVKGKGFLPAERDPIGYHAITKLEPEPPVKAVKPKPPKKPKYSSVFGDWLCDMAKADTRLVGITPAMCEGSDLLRFSREYPDRYHDVAICEQHAVTLAAGMACEQAKPVVAIYSTFLQRGYDQLIHDVAVQNLDVTFAIDRAGLVGEDGPTHAGSFDLTYLRCIPNMLVMAPSDENETRLLLNTGYLHDGPAAVRYPRGTGPGATISESLEGVEVGRGVLRRQGDSVAILSFGALLAPALRAADRINCSVADMRFVKPIDEKLIRKLVCSHRLLVTLEENSITGGAGAAVLEFLQRENLTIPVLNLGLPDTFLEHGKPADMLNDCGLSAEGIETSIENRLTTMSSTQQPASG